LTRPKWAFDMEANMAVTKTDTVVRVMTEMNGQPVDSIFAAIVEAIRIEHETEYTISRARSVYLWCIKHGRAEGELPVKAKKAAKPKAAKKVSVPATKKARIEIANKVRELCSATATKSKSAADIEAIRAANLEKIKQVHQKMIAQGDLPNTLKEEIEVEIESDKADDEEIERDFPQFLNKSAVTEMVGFGFDRELEE
jgi:hypothetical protein